MKPLPRPYGRRFKFCSLNSVENRLNKLLDLYLDERISEQDYNSKKAELEKMKHDLSRDEKQADENSNNWRVKVENSFDFAKALSSRFKNGDREIKHQILIKISSDLLYESKNPLINLKKEYSHLKNIKNNREDLETVARTSKYADILMKNPDLTPVNSTWLPLLDSLRNGYKNNLLDVSLNETNTLIKNLQNTNYYPK